MLNRLLNFILGFGIGTGLLMVALAVLSALLMPTVPESILAPLYVGLLLLGLLILTVHLLRNPDDADHSYH